MKLSDHDTDVGAPGPNERGPDAGARSGLHLHHVEAGDGRPVVLLHGFPDFWYTWRHQLPELADAGFRAVAPDLRGYGLSDKPRGVDAYRLECLVRDVATLIRRLGAGPADVVGHDWGGAIAWALAMRRPRLVRRMAILNAPHPATFRRELRNPRQALRSLYILFFQLPWLPEALLRAGNFAALRRLFRNASTRPGAFTEEAIERHVAAMARPGALTAALNYYRALRRPTQAGALWQPRPVSAPTLVVWGERDPYLTTGILNGLGAWAPDLTIRRLPDAGHWVHHDAPETVNRWLIDFLREERRPQSP